MSQTQTSIFNRPIRTLLTSTDYRSIKVNGYWKKLPCFVYPGDVIEYSNNPSESKTSTKETKEQ